MGALGGLLCCGLAAYYTRNTPIIVATALLAAVSTLRVANALFCATASGASGTDRAELIYRFTAFLQAGLSGFVGAMTLTIDAPERIQLLSCAFAVAYGVGNAARNAGRPAIAVGQLLLSIAPVMFAALMVGGVPLYALAATLAFVMHAMTVVTLSVFRVLREQLVSAENSAKLADGMRDLARTDVVTGLLNRAGLNHELVERLMELPDGRQLALLWLDLDRFKEINDMLGHAVGDRVLSEVAARLRSQAPENAVIARFGGDEFIIACQVADRGECERLANAVSAELARAFRIDDQRIDASASMGVALLPEDGPDIDSLMQGADLALYHAKINGAHQIRFFTPSMTRELVRKKAIESELRAALRRDELSIFFQPIVDLKTGRIRSFEALVRWYHPEKGELRPDEFIPVAEETGVIITLGNWITAQAAKAAAQWPEDVTIAVNLSPVQIRAPGAALGILNALREAKLDPSRLQLEVTESLFVENGENTARFINELAKEGVRFALDDFGTGYSSLAYINQYPFRTIKVDRSFVSGPNVGRKSDAIIRAVAEMGSTLEMEIVAEGLETVEQVQAVRDAGCTLGQGYYFSRAVPDFLAAVLLAQDRDREDVPRLAG